MSVIHRLIRLAGDLLRDEAGPSATEYAILLALLVLGAMGAIGGIGSRVYNIYARIEAAVAAAGM